MSTYEEESYDDEIDDGDIDPEWAGSSIEYKYDAFVEKLRNAGFSYLNQGSFRKVYERDKVVIKVPVVSDGLIDNMVEHATYHRYWNSPMPNGVMLAPCRLLANGCLMMRKCEFADSFRGYPEWAFLIDGKQVGPYKGRMVAYDYALDITDRFEWEREWKQTSNFFNSEEWRYRRPHIDAYLRKKEQLRTG